VVKQNYRRLLHCGHLEFLPIGTAPPHRHFKDLHGKHLVLGLTGGIACYKSAELCRLLVKEGATVQVVMTGAAEQFITAVTLQALSGRPVYTSQWDAREANNMPHINLGRAADAILIAPCSADFMVKLVPGSAAGLQSPICLAPPADPVPAPLAPAPEDTGGDEVAAILFTSGSTGLPKGVVYRHRHFIAQIQMLRDA